jgi:hypothetical protein
VRLDYGGSVIVNASHGSVCPAAMHRVSDCAAAFQLKSQIRYDCLVFIVRNTLLMTTKFLAFMSVIGVATVCVVQAQSPTPSESPSVSVSPAEKAASPSPAESPTASPKAKPTPKKEKAERKARPAASPMPAGRTTEEAVNSPAPGGGPGLLWVNTEAGVYHGQRSPFYGTTRKGKYMTEQDAIQAGYKRAPKGR